MGDNPCMIHDAKVEVTCDGGCGDSIEIQPQFVCPTYSGNNGYYDTSDSAIEKHLLAEDWTVQDGMHFCESCTETNLAKAQS